VDHAFIDIETYSDLPIKNGTWAYAAHPSTEILLIGAALNDGPVHQWSVVEGEPMPKEIEEIIFRFGDKEMVVHAFNAQFERACFSNLFTAMDFPVWQWRCDMVLALSLSLPASLDKAGALLGIDADKQKIGDGKRLIQKFCTRRKKPRKTLREPESWVRYNYLTDPVDWEKFKQYHVNDILAEREVYKKLKRWDLSESEWADWHLDQQINQRGLPVDVDLVKYAIPLCQETRDIYETMMQVYTGMKKPNYAPGLLQWINDHGVDLPNTRKDTIKLALEGDLPGDVRQVLLMRQQTGKTSNAKYTAIAKGMNEDGRLRGCFQFSGAGRTGRWSGRLFQPQNLPRPVISKAEIEKYTNLVRQGEPLDTTANNVLEITSSIIRSAIRAPGGQHLIVADLSSIENVVLGWVSDCKGINAIHRDGLDPYKSFGVRFFGKDYEGITRGERNLCKPPVLGAGFGIGGGKIQKDKKTGLPYMSGLWGYAHAMGIPLEQEEAIASVQTWREMYFEVVQMWYELEDAFRRCIKSRSSQRVGPVMIVSDKPFVRIRLPGGRFLSYLRPRIEWRVPPWEEEEEKPKPRLTITYEGRSDTTAGGWYRVPTRGAKLMENIVQAIANDVLRAGIREAMKFGIDVVGHVHDEVIAQTKTNYDDHALQELIKHMTAPMPWAPDMCLRADGYISKFYKKD